MQRTSGETGCKKLYEASQCINIDRGVPNFKYNVLLARFAGLVDL